MTKKDMKTIRNSDIRRHGESIRLGQGRTAREGMDGTMPTLEIGEKGRTLKFYRGSSLYFSRALTEEDREYLAQLGSF